MTPPSLRLAGGSSTRADSRRSTSSGNSSMFWSSWDASGVEDATAVRSSLSVGMLESELPSDWRSLGVPAR